MRGIRFGQGAPAARQTRDADREPRWRSVPARWLAHQNRWLRRLVALASGALGALALAPIDFGPALVWTLCTAVWLLDACERHPSGAPRLRAAFGAGWWLGFGYFLAGFWWLGAAFLVDPEFTWALPVGVIGVPAALAFFPAFGFLVAGLLWGDGGSRVLALAVGLGGAEWARGHVLTGFPWNPFGMGLGGSLVTAQTASLIGLDGLSLLTVAIFAAPATLLDRHRTLVQRSAPTVLALTATAAIVGFGALRLRESRPAFVPDVIVRIMQPGLRPDVNFSPENKDAIVSHYIDLSQRDDRAKHIRLDQVTMLVWPESAFPFILMRDPEELARIADALPPHTTLVTGAAREQDVPAFGGEPEHFEYFNDIMVIGHSGKLLDAYDKIHLVPFGEYLPFNALLRRLGLRNFVPVPGGFEFGRERHPLSVAGMPPALPLICYEAIFPNDLVIDKSGGRPGYLLNVTNDGWFGLTSGPSQHFAQARLRTIEQGLPMVRGAATGISAMVDPYGRVLAQLPLGAEGIVDARLPRPIAATPFSKIGEWPFAVAWCALLALSCARRLRH